ncbi:putative xyloglucan 6-xylosyltransferase 1 [Canna indica]|uniref:Xyloglucan 6-xylosyltransferase 1 n=1 Tax=Canna indica TaxID=4628 RepID=A0AAQ3KWD2_9LILI|nr:putative xyloglucan 6-xylosyltransferase 1 [Canna indica]
MSLLALLRRRLQSRNLNPYPKLHKTILEQYSGIPSEAPSSPFSTSPSPSSSSAAPLVPVSSAPPSRTSIRSIFASVVPLSTPPPRPLRTSRTTASRTPLATPRSPTRLAPRYLIGTSIAPSGSAATQTGPASSAPTSPERSWSLVHPPNPARTPSATTTSSSRSRTRSTIYYRVHGIEIFYNTALLDDEMDGLWAKLPLIRSLLLTHPEVEFLWWMDSDAMFTDLAFELPWERYAPYNLVMHGWNEMVYDDHNWIGLNTGSFLLHNRQWSLDLLDAYPSSATRYVSRRCGSSRHSWGSRSRHSGGKLRCGC